MQQATQLSNQKIQQENFIIFYILSVVTILSLMLKFSASILVQVPVLAVLVATTLYLLNNYKFKISSFLVPSLCFVAVVFIGYFNADCRVLVRDHLFVLIYSVLAAFNITFLSSQQKKKFLLVVLFVAFWFSVIVLITSILSYNYRIDTFYNAIFLSVNVLAGFLTIAFPLFFIFIREKIYPKVFASMATVAFFAIALTMSRASIVAVIIFLLIFLYNYRKNKFVKVSMIFLVVVTVILAIYISTVKPWLSLSARSIWWQTAVSIFKDNIFFGCGFYNFSALFLKYRMCVVENTLYVHNIFLQLLADTGILGFTSFVAIIVCFYKKVKENIKKDKNSYLNIAVCFGVTLFLIANLLDCSFFAPANMMIFFMLIASVFSANPQKLEKKRVAVIVPLILFVVILFFIAKPFIANIYYKIAMNFYNDKNYSQALALFEKSVHYDNINPEYYAQISGLAFDIYRGSIEVNDNYNYIGKTEDNLNKAIALYKSSAELKVMLANVYLSTGRYKQALETLQEALNYDKYNQYLQKYVEDIIDEVNRRQL